MWYINVDILSIFCCSLKHALTFYIENPKSRITLHNCFDLRWLFVLVLHKTSFCLRLCIMIFLLFFYCLCFFMVDVVVVIFATFGRVTFLCVCWHDNSKLEAFMPLGHLGPYRLVCNSWIVMDGFFRISCIWRLWTREELINLEYTGSDCIRGHVWIPYPVDR